MNPNRVLILALCCLVGWGGFGSSPAFAGETEPHYVLKAGTLAPKGVGWAKQVEEILVPEVSRASDGDVSLKVYWGGILGDDEDYLRKIRIGQLQGAGLSGAGATMACPEFAVVELPFLFNGYDEVDYIRDRMTGSFDYYFAQNQLKLGWWMDQDFDQLYSSKNALGDLADFKQSRFVTWYGPIEEAVLKALGARAVTLDVPQISAEWNARRIDAAMAPAIWMVGAQMYTVVRYVNPIKIRYSPVPIAFGLDAWNDLPKSFRERIMDSRKEITARFTEGSRKDNEKSLEAMIAYGVKKTNMLPGNFAVIRDRCMSVYDELADEVYPLGLLQELLRYLNDYRAGRPGSPYTLPADWKPRKKARAKDEARRSAWQERLRQNRAVQEKLKTLGFYHHEVDGIFGPDTYKAIERFQKASGLRQTGAPGPEVLEALGIK